MAKTATKKVVKYRLKKTRAINGTEFKAGTVKSEKEWAKICQQALPFFRQNFKKNFIKLAEEEPLKITELDIQKVEEGISIMMKVLKKMKEIKIPNEPNKKKTNNKK